MVKPLLNILSRQKFLWFCKDTAKVSFPSCVRNTYTADRTSNKDILTKSTNHCEEEDTNTVDRTSDK